MKFIFLFLLFSLSAMALEAPSEEKVEPGDEDSLPCTMSYVAGSPDEIDLDDRRETKTKSKSKSKSSSAKSQ